LPGAGRAGRICGEIFSNYRSEPAMADDENLPVRFRVRIGKDVYNCRGQLVRERGLVYAIPEPDDDSPFLPDRVSLEESDLELRHDAAEGDYYQYHGFIYIY
jgi:hypothetical protein